MKNENLHWVFCCRGGNVEYFLANQNNQPLDYPILQNLSEQEIHILANFDVICESIPVGNNCVYALPVSEDKDVICAPLYVEVKRDKEYSMIGEYTGEWTNPKIFYHVNEMVRKIVPMNKISFHGCYVEI